LNFSNSPERGKQPTLTEVLQHVFVAASFLLVLRDFDTMKLLSGAASCLIREISRVEGQEAILRGRDGHASQAPCLACFDIEAAHAFADEKYGGFP
jgi:hypothetical protein